MRLETEEQKIAGYSIIQRWGDLEGRGNRIFARLDMGGYNGTRNYRFRVDGSYYPEPNVSVQPRVSLPEAKAALIKQYNEWQVEICSKPSGIAEIVAPQPRCDPPALLNESMLLAREEELRTPPMPKSALKIRVERNETAQRLEYRLVWNIWLKAICSNDAHVDAITGELLAVNDHCMY